MSKVEMATRVWQNRDYMPWAQVADAREALGIAEDEEAQMLRTPEGRETLKQRYIEEGQARAAARAAELI